MYGLNHQFPLQDQQTYIFDLKSLNTIELSLRKTINQRFSSKIHFRAPRPKPRPEPHLTTPLAQVFEDERESALEKFTPSKTTNKEMKILSTASKMGKDSEAESPEGKATPKGKLIFKERTPPIKSSRFGLKVHYYYPMG
jgi:hypothetical protein